MTRKDFVLIAETIKDATLSAYAKRMLAIQFASRLRGTNSNFDRERFIRACTGEA